MSYARIEDAYEYWLDPPEDTRETLEYCAICGEELKDGDEIYHNWAKTEYYCTSCVRESYAEEEDEDEGISCYDCGEQIKAGQVMYILDNKKHCCEECLEKAELESRDYY